MPEEINRVLTDAISDLLFCTEQSGVENLRREGVADAKDPSGRQRDDRHAAAAPRARRGVDRCSASSALEPAATRVLTLHRPSNVDDPAALARLLDALEVDARATCRSSFPVHPRTRQKLRAVRARRRGSRASRGCGSIDPAGYLDFLKLMASRARSC